MIPQLGNIIEVRLHIEGGGQWLRGKVFEVGQTWIGVEFIDTRWDTVQIPADRRTRIFVPLPGDDWRNIE